MSNSTTASTVILEYVCPCLGMLLSNSMWLAPVRALQRSVRCKQLNDLNPTPWAVMLGNCYGWVLYSILIGNFWVYFANAPGILISVWLNLGAVRLLYQEHHSRQMRQSFIEHYEENERRRRSSAVAVPGSGDMNMESTNDQETQAGNDKERQDQADTNSASQTVTTNPLHTATETTAAFAKRLWDVTSQTTPAKTPHEKLVMIIVGLWMAISSIVGFAGSTNLIQTSSWPSSSTNTQIVGYAVNFNLVFFYGAPLSTIWTVLKQRNTNTIHIPTLITNTLNGTFWLAYGIAIADWFILVPNGLGAALGGIQIVLLVLFPRTKQKDEHEAENLSEDEDGNEANEENYTDIKENNIITDESSSYDPEQPPQSSLPQRTPPIISTVAEDKDDVSC